jgi:uncharacterized protein YjdB
LKTWGQRVRPYAVAAIVVCGLVFSGCSDGNEITDKTVAVTGVTLDKTELGLGVGDDYTLTATVLPANASDKTVTWKSSKTAVATVTDDGKVTGKAFGDAIITVTAKNGKNATCFVTVGDIDVTGVTLQPELSLEIGETFRLTPDVQPPNAANKNVDWLSDTPGVATVIPNGTDDGTVTAVSLGTAIITVTTRNGGLEASCAVTVSDTTVKSVTLPTDFYVAVGGRKTLTPTFSPEYLSISDKNVDWLSDTPEVVTVNADGIVTGVAEGVATITATSVKDSTKTATCIVIVDLGMLERMVTLPSGTFDMGSPDTEPERDEDETLHQVTLSSFYMYETPVLLTDYYWITGDNPTYFTPYYKDLFGDDWMMCPTDGVTWYDAVEFCNKLSEMEGFTPVYTITGRRPATGLPITGATVTCNWTANGYRLPTEAEWEYACRAGTTTPFNTGENITTDQANYDGKYPYNGNDPGGYIGYPVLPYLYEPNDFGLYTMHGNLEEWCWDWYGEDYYENSVQTNPRGPNVGTSRVTRGGSFIDEGRYLRSAMRYRYEPNEEYQGPGLPFVGFRFVRNVKE